ncbi:MAG TPA: choice-of-anchor tandem repeat GloVer-containing protein [Verrucomicrobiae bacterium]|nr:choice-of-anchor tandem repeat GloVer-containing protein [Verrucomicrobiae bacterium]
MVQSIDGKFYGTTLRTGPLGYGTFFVLTSAGTFSTLHTFNPNTDGAYPTWLVQGIDGNFYGAAEVDGGGLTGRGTIFKVSSAGTFTNLHTFTGGDGSGPNGLVQGNDSNFYGTAYAGGFSGGPNNLGNGTIFRISPTGAFATLYLFPGGVEATGSPTAGLVQGGDDDLYGTTYYGGSLGVGSVFRITTNGTITTLYSFLADFDGFYLKGGLAQGSGGDFYGTTLNGGGNSLTNSRGSVFRITPAGTLTTLYTFTGGSDGAQPKATLIKSTDGSFYGTTSAGGTGGWGTIFRITEAGTLTTLYRFTGGQDGGNPETKLVEGADGDFYGVAPTGGVYGCGTVFRLSRPTAQAPMIAPNGGMYTNSVQVALSCTTAGATISYTTDGTDPSTNSAAYSTPLTLTNSATVKAIAFASGYKNSAIASADFIVCSYSVDPLSRSHGASIETGSVTVTTGSDCTWTGMSGATWITIISGSSGTGNGVVNYSVAPNTDNCITRTGTLVIAGQTFTVTQDAGVGSFSIAPLSRTHGAGTETGTVTVTAGNGCAWIATSNAGWITVTYGSGVGNGSVSYTLQVNNTGSTRIGTLTAAGQTFTVTQTACNYSLSSTFAAFSATGGNGNVAVTTTAGCAWTADTEDGWITITSVPSGVGNGTVTYTVAPNLDPSGCSGTLTVAGQTVTVTQAGNAPPQTSITPVLPIAWPASTVNLVATVTDDGAPYGTLTTAWSKLSGLGTVSFGNASAANTTATFSTNGTYLLQLTASDGALSTSNTVSVIVDMVPAITSTPSVVSNSLLQVGDLTLAPAGEDIGFGVGVTDADGNPLNCQWVFCGTSTNFDWEPTHVFTDCGPCIVSVTVTDNVAAAVTSNFTVSVPCVLNISRLRVKANFAKPNRDRCRLKAKVALPTGFGVKDKLATLSIADAQVAFTLNRKGRGVNYPNSCTMTYNKNRGIWIFTATLKKGAWQVPWSAYGITDTTVLKPGNTVNLPVILVLDTESFMATTNLYYTAKAGKSGVAK